jgi:phosphate transport system protein
MPEQAVRKALSQGMHELNENMVTLAELSEYAIRRAVDSLARMDSKSAEEVFTIDREVYALQIEIEKRCGDLIALHAPVAGDLRLITTSLKITTDFDRIGRYSKDIAEITLQIQNGKDREFERLPGLPRMVDLTIEMVDRAASGFVHRDAESVRDLAKTDDAVDALHDETLRAIVAHMKDGSLAIDVGAWYILVNRYLERIADHAVNIGERVVYMVTGERLPRIRAAERARWKSP